MTLRTDSLGSAHDFDFLIGSWSVRHRKLAARLQGSETWIEFPGSLEVDPILGGQGDIDRNVLNDPVGKYNATSLRIFDPNLKEWSIYWIDGRTPTIANPVVGRFHGKVGQFFTDDLFDNRPIRIRFIYEDVDPGTARWAQAFSLDDGRAWETNWTMEFFRLRRNVG